MTLSTSNLLLSLSKVYSKEECQLSAINSGQISVEELTSIYSFCPDGNTTPFKHTPHSCWYGKKKNKVVPAAELILKKLLFKACTLRYFWVKWTTGLAGVVSSSEKNLRLTRHVSCWEWQQTGNIWQELRKCEGCSICEVRRKRHSLPCPFTPPSVNSSQTWVHSRQQTAGLGCSFGPCGTGWVPGLLLLWIPTSPLPLSSLGKHLLWTTTGHSWSQLGGGSFSSFVK